MNKPSDKLDDDHVEWVIDGHKRSVRIRSTYRIVFKVLVWLFDALKWVADSLKWAVPLFLALGAAYQSGFIDALKEWYG